MGWGNFCGGCGGGSSITGEARRAAALLLSPPLPLQRYQHSLKGFVVSDMASAKRRKGDSGGYFNPEWELPYFVIDDINGVKCLVRSCGKIIAQRRRYNIERHYKTFHQNDYQSLEGDARKEMLEEFKQAVLDTTSSSCTSPECEVRKVNVFVYIIKVA